MLFWRNASPTGVTPTFPNSMPMTLTYSIQQRTLHFRQPAGTSRGVYHTRDVWYVTLSQGQRQGTGECAPLHDLSCDAFPPGEYEEYLHAAARLTCQLGRVPCEQLLDYPSILFGLECAWLHLNHATPLPQGPLCPINGLVWMGTYDEMRERLEEKLQAGYRCVKLKIGAINFEDELRLIQRVRQDYPRERVELRVDANGGLGQHTQLACVMDKLQRLAQYDLHSIEQPIPAGHWEEMAELCRTSPLPIALDEELIGVNHPDRKAALLDTIRPRYIILKPSLHGALSGCDEWIRLATQRGIGWWATSALESNVGLADIALWVSQYQPAMPQGLGTGLLFTDNTPAQTEVRGDELYFTASLVNE